VRRAPMGDARPILARRILTSAAFRTMKGFISYPPVGDNEPRVIDSCQPQAAVCRFSITRPGFFRNFKLRSNGNGWARGPISERAALAATPWCSCRTASSLWPGEIVNSLFFLRQCWGSWVWKIRLLGRKARRQCRMAS